MTTSASKNELLIRVRTSLDEAVRDLRQLEKELDRVGSANERLFPPIQQSSSALRTFVAAGGALIALSLAKRTLEIADAYAGLDTRIRTATKGTGDYLEVQRELLAISIRNGTALETTVSVFQNLARTAPELRANNTQILELTNLVQQLGVISGSTRSQMQAGLMQFTQGLAGGVFRAEEFNSILENLPELATRIASGMGKTVGELRRAVINGEVLSKDVFDALIKQAPAIAREFAEIEPTIQRGGSALAEAILARLDQVNEKLAITSSIARGLQALAEGIRPETIGEIRSELEKLYSARAALAAAPRIGPFLNPIVGAQLAAVNREIEKLEAKLPKGAGKPDAPGKEPVDPKQIELSKSIAEATAKFKEQAATVDGTHASLAAYLTTVGKFKDATDAEKLSLIDAAAALDAQAAAAKRTKDAKDDLAADQKLATKLEAEVNALNASELERDRIQAKLQATSQLSATATDEYRKRVETLADRLFSLKEAARSAQTLLQIEADLMRAGGNAAGADRLELLERYGRTIDELARRGDQKGLDTLFKGIDLELARREFQRIADERSRIMDRLNTQESRVNTDREAGLITEMEARRRIVELHQQTSQELDAQLPRMRELAAALGPDAVAAVERFAEENRRAGLVIDETLQRIKGSIESGLVDAMEQVISNTNSAGEAFEAFGQVVLKTLYRIAAEQFVTQLLSTFGFNELGVKKATAPPSAQNNAAGGLIRGPGTGTSDSILSWISDGEYVVKASAVRKLGVPFLDRVNAGRIPVPDFSSLMPRFAAGGLVGSTAAMAGAGAGFGTVVQVINNTGADVRTEPGGRDADGREITRVVIGMVSKDIHENGTIARTLQSVFGLNRGGRSR